MKAIIKAQFMTRVQRSVDGSLPEHCLVTVTPLCELKSLLLRSVYATSRNVFFPQVKTGKQADLTVLFIFRKTNFLPDFYLFV
jgi:hypothetical protein